MPGMRRIAMKTHALSDPRVLAPSTYRRMPWLNGGGRTTEIFVAPPGAPLDGFAWRVSLADVGASGPFSAFPGVDRILVLVSGRGMRLTGDGGTLDVTRPFEPVRFAGDRPLECALAAGPARDFNLMVRRGVVRGDVWVVRDAATPLPRADVYLCYAARGACDCRIAGGEPVALPEDHSLLVEADGAMPAPGLEVHPRDAGAVALVAVMAMR
jgi:environmental stress-induced protein Ves